ncbi:E3 ubiquitin-protein ligase RNF8 (RING finger protein 8) (RING-type E3 ubiquitin transferase RNF8) [Durusdinium trenchii]|uniref:E3 ubiquitin-protein ligase CHFR n=1 Tax=Durusdinium trenchii TaxID=1381693 RepID=A0ABP0QBM1_9DINO
MPNCDIVMDSTRFPQMISRTHARLVTTNVGTPQQEWAIHDCKSMNGVTVNGEAVGVSGRTDHVFVFCRTLRMGDVVNFGKRVVPPEFEFIFEAPQSSGLAEEAEPMMPLLVQMKRIADLEQDQCLIRHPEAQEAIPKGLKISELSNELACCVCKDWLVHAATIQCSHTFCWSCIDQWLQTKQFVCPVCRKEVTREPVRTRAVDAVVQKTVSQISAEEQAPISGRQGELGEFDAFLRRSLEHSSCDLSKALRAGKKFFHINQLWGKKDKETFKKGVNQYPAGNARERYCKLTGMTVQWAEGSDEGAAWNLSEESRCIYIYTIIYY